MQNAESYVALGRDNSGAAAIPRGANPMAGAFAVYDAEQAGQRKRKTALLDSLGNDLAGITGQAWEVDFPEINAERDKFLNMKADYMARGVDISRDPKAFLEIQQQKQKVIDLASKSKMDRQTYQGLVIDIRNNPELYDPEEVKKFEQEWANTPVSKRGKDAGIKQIPDTKWIPDIREAAGILYDATSEERKMPDGTYKTISGTKLNTQRLDENFSTFWNIANSENAPIAYRQFTKSIENRVKSEAAAQGKNWDALPINVKVQAVTAEAKKQFATYGKSDEQVKKGSSLTGESERAYGNGLGSKGINITYKEQRAKETDQEGAPVLDWKIWMIADPKQTENSPHEFKDEQGKPVYGYVTAIRETKDGNRTQLVIVENPVEESENMVGEKTKKRSPNISYRYLPYSKWNEQKLLTAYEFDKETWSKANGVGVKGEAKPTTEKPKKRLY